MRITIQVRGHFSLFRPVLANVRESKTLLKSTASAGLAGPEIRLSFMAPFSYESGTLETPGTHE